MNELEKAAKEYADKNYPKMDLYGDWEDDGFDEGWNAAKNSSGQADFIAGAEWQSKQSPWIRTEDKMPEDNELVLTSSSIYGTKLLVWNEFHKVWDDEDGDDTYCERDKIDAWMKIPE